MQITLLNFISMKAITKNILLLTIVLFTSNFIDAQCVTVNAGGDQTICTGSANLLMTYTPVKATTSYTVATTTYAWDAAISSTGTTALATGVDDIYSALIPIGFCFQFYGVTYTQCVIGSNGVVTFNTADASAYCPYSYTATLPSTSLPKNSIMSPYHDIDPSINPAGLVSEIKYKTYGTAPCRTFVVSWSNVPMFSCTSMTDDQQMILYETTNNIDVMIKNKPMCSGWNGGRAILGVQDNAGLLSTVAPGKNSTQWTEGLTGYRFSPAGTEISTVKWLQGATLIGTTPTATVTPTVTTTYTAQITVTTCAAPGTLVITEDMIVTVSTGTTPTFAAIPNVCQNGTPPVLPLSSTNTPAITGTWSPAVSTTTVGPATYTFTPAAGQCATTTTTTITTLATNVPTFALVSAVCLNSTPPVLPTSSTNTPAIAGTWSPAVSTAVAGTAIYTFTPTVSTCTSTATLSIVTTSSITPTFAAIANVCQNAAAPTLPLSSTNTPAITGVWSPAVSTAALGLTTYTFTPAAGQCAGTTTNTITVSTPVLPTFTAIANVCQNAAIPVLPTSSTNTPPLTGTWLPAVSTATVGTATYTFTPTAGLCASTATNSITVLALNTPTFTPISDLCLNSTVPTLASSSNNTIPIAGTWSPSIISSATAGTATYTFTPTVSMCTSTATLNILTTSSITPTFTAVAPVCQNSTPPVLPTSSTNTVPLVGVWSPAVSTSVVGTATYTFTPNAGQCGVNTTLNIVTTTQITPTFSAVANVCQNSVAPVLPSSSTNVPAITGTWSSLVSTATTGPTTYTFTPTVGLCASTATLIVTINTPITPTFTAIAAVCQNATAPVLPTSSTNIPAISGTWSSVVSTSTLGSTTYTFTPATGVCAVPSTVSITVSTPIVPTFGAIPSVCQNATVPVLPNSSTNTTPVIGSWLPTVSTSTAGTTTYTFTPTAGLCATTATNTITVIPNITPTFAAIANVCQNDVAPVLNTTSTNSPVISGSWAPAVSTSLVGVSIYTFTPTVVTGFCSNTTTLTITVNPQATPLFTAVSPLCQGAVAPVLPTASNNIPPISGVWSPAVNVNAVGTSTYVFVPSAGQCSTNGTLSLTVKPLPVLVVFNPAPVCSPLTIDLTVPSITLGSTGTRSISSSPSGLILLPNPSAISASGTYFVVSDSNGCKVVLPVQVIVNPKPEAYFTPSKTILSSNNLTSVMLNNSTDADSYEWYFMDGSTSTLTDPSHTFPDSVYGDQLITMIASSIHGCKDTVSKIVTIEEELIYYIPNAFTPDVDQYNPTFQPVFNSGYDPYDFTMLIFNRWGEIVFETHDVLIGWDGKFGGKIMMDETMTWKIEFKIKGKDKHVVETGHVSILR